MDSELVAFCREEHPRLVGALSLYCGDALVAEELAQEALLRAVQRWDHVRGMASPQGWVHRVGLNLAHSLYRRRQAEQRARRRLGDPSPMSDPRAAAEAIAVRQAVGTLPQRQRACIVWRYYLGWSVDEVAGTLGVSNQAVAALTQRALAGLRQRLGDSRLVWEEGARET